MQTLADDVAYGLLSLRAKQNEQLVQGAILKLAANVSSNPSVLFEQLVINLASALRANGAFIARLLPDKPGFARTINAVIDGKTTENFDYLIIDSPCKHLFIDEQCVYKKGVANYFPNSSSLSAFSAQAYVGQILKNSAAEIIGFMFVLFRSPLEDEAFITSTIKIFAARAATELERLSIDAHALQ